MTIALDDIQKALKEVREKLQAAGYSEMPENYSHQYFDLAAKILLKDISKDLGSEWSFYVAGCWGRSRLKRGSDQDHYIFLRSKPGNRDILSLKFQKMERVLHELGLELCSGSVMASNPKWQIDLDSFDLKAQVKAFSDAQVLMHGRFLAGTSDLRPPEIYDYYKSSDYRKSGLRFIIHCYLLLMISGQKDRAGLLRDMEIADFVIRDSRKSLPDEKFPVSFEKRPSYGQGLLKGSRIVRNLLNQYSYFFS